MTEFEIMKDCFTKSKMNIQVKENEIDHIVMWDKDNNTPTYIIKFFFNERGICLQGDNKDCTTAIPNTI